MCEAHGLLLDRALERLVPVTQLDAVKESGMSPLHSAAAGGHAHCVELLLKAGYDPNFMLHPRVRRNYDDERRSALFFAVSNNDLHCTRLLLEAGAMVNQDPVNCLQVALRQGNYELINTLLKFGANVNYYSRVNTTHFPSALQPALKDEVMLRMILNHGYDVKRCFDCPYGDSSHDYAPWTTSVIKDMVVRRSLHLIWSCVTSLESRATVVLADVDHVSEEASMLSSGGRKGNPFCRYQRSIWAEGGGLSATHNEADCPFSHPLSLLFLPTASCCQHFPLLALCHPKHVHR